MTISKNKIGLSRQLIEEISWHKNEPDWMRQIRLKSFDIFLSKPMPLWGPDLSMLNFDTLAYYLQPGSAKETSWNKVPKDVKKTFDKLGIPKFEQKYLAGQVVQFESEGIYQNLKKQYEAQGIIFCDMDTAVQKYPELVKEYFMTKCVPAGDNKFSALHGAVWSGGSFVYIPKDVKLNLPLQTYFWMNSKQSGQFEHTLIIAEEGSDIQYIEGCTAPRFFEQSLHSAVVEIFVKKSAKVRYTTIQNWAKNIYNLNTKRSLVYESGTMEWLGGSLGSKVSMLYPASYLIGRGARADHLNIALAGKGQIKDTGAKVFHGAPDTTSNVVSKSIGKDGGQNIYRGLIKVANGAKRVKAHVRCDALLLDSKSSAKAYPHLEVYESDASVGHEATTGKISDEQIFYLRTRGMTQQEAMSMIVSGFVEPIVRQLPMEYAIELNRLIDMEMEGL